MKSMLSGLDFSGVKLKLGDKTKLLTGGREAAVELIRRHNDNLVKALVAALAVIGIDRSDYQSEAAYMYDLMQNQAKLETALEPFKVVGGDAKDGV